MIPYLLLACCVSIDSLGIGITYGIKDTKISFFAKVILAIIAILLGKLSILRWSISSTNITKQ